MTDSDVSIRFKAGADIWTEDDGTEFVRNGHSQRVSPERAKALLAPQWYVFEALSSEEIRAEKAADETVAREAAASAEAARKEREIEEKRAETVVGGLLPGEYAPKAKPKVESRPPTVTGKIGSSYGD